MIGLEGPERIGDSMKPLKNALHERFAQLVVSGKSKSEAYREVYPKSREWADKDVHTEASRLYPKVSPRVQALQGEIAKLICIEKSEAVSILAEGLRASPADVKDTSRFAQEMIIDPVSGKVTIRLPSKTALFSELAKSLGWYEPEKSVIDHRVSADEAVAARIGAELDRIRGGK